MNKHQHAFIQRDPLVKIKVFRNLQNCEKQLLYMNQSKKTNLRKRLKKRVFLKRVS